MLPRQQPSRNDASLPREVKEAKRTLRVRGWSYRTAAPHLGVGWPHLAKVLTGQRRSAALLRRIAQLPPRSEIETTP